MGWKYWVILNIAVTAGWAVCSKLARNYLSPQTTSLSIITVAWVVCFALNIKGFNYKFNPIGMGWVLLCGIFGGLTNITYYRFIKDVPLHVGIPLNEMYLLLIPVLSFLIFKDSIHWNHVIGIILGLFSIVLLMKGN